MTTQEVAQQWATYCQTGQWDKAHEELYDSNCASIEMEGAPGGIPKVVGMEAIKAKGQQWGEMVGEFHGVEIEGPIVAGNHFTAVMKMDLTMKGRPRNVDEEIAVFQVENGKIVSEQFFYSV
ncbi:MAG: nuclear transport factor 2 family protein [Bacteroidota bacterium]